MKLVIEIDMDRAKLDPFWGETVAMMLGAAAINLAENDDWSPFLRELVDEDNDVCGSLKLED